MADKGLNATAAALLGLLHDGAMTGGQLMAAADARLGPFWTTTRSQVYRELPLLAEAGYVRAGKQGPRSSQPYSVTATGKRAFTRWLNEPAGRDQLRNPLLLRAAFGELHNTKQLAELYESQHEEREAKLEELKVQFKEAKKQQADSFLLSTLDFAITYQKAVLKWLASAPKKS